MIMTVVLTLTEYVSTTKVAHILTPIKKNEENSKHANEDF